MFFEIFNHIVFDNEMDVISCLDDEYIRAEMTAEEVANSLNLTRERVRQIKERALRRLREADNIKILMKYLG